MFLSVCVRASERQTKRKRGEGAGEVFLEGKKGARKRGEYVKNRSSFCHAVVPPALLSVLLSLPLLLPLSLYLPFLCLLPCLSFFTSLWFVFPPNPPVILFPSLSMRCMCVCVCECVCRLAVFFFKPLWCTTAPWGELFSPFQTLKHTHTQISYAPALTYFPNTCLRWSLIPSSLSMLNYSCPASLTHFHYSLRHRLCSQKVLAQKILLFSLCCYTSGYFNLGSVSQT